MRRPEPSGPPMPSWVEWLSVAWAVVVGVLYVGTVLRARAPGLMERLGDVIGR